MAIQSRCWKEKISTPSNRHSGAASTGRACAHPVASPRNDGQTPSNSRKFQAFAIRAAVALYFVHSKKRGWHGSHSHRRRQQAQRHHSDLGREECRATPNDRGPVVRGNADPRQHAAACRRRPTAAHSRQSRGRYHVGGETPRRPWIIRPTTAPFAQYRHLLPLSLSAALAAPPPILRSLLVVHAASGALM